MFIPLTFTMGICVYIIMMSIDVDVEWHIFQHFVWSSSESVWAESFIQSNVKGFVIPWHADASPDNDQRKEPNITPTKNGQHVLIKMQSSFKK